MRTDEGWDETLRQFDEKVGLERLSCFHVNDSRKGLNCRVDRHAHIGQGEMGLLPFWHLVNDARTRNIPMVLETPKAGDMDRRNLSLLRRLASSPPGPAVVSMRRPMAREIRQWPGARAEKV